MKSPCRVHRLLLKFDTNSLFRGDTLKKRSTPGNQSNIWKPKMKCLVILMNQQLSIISNVLGRTVIRLTICAMGKNHMLLSYMYIYVINTAIKITIDILSNLIAVLVVIVKLILFHNISVRYGLTLMQISKLSRKSRFTIAPCTYWKILFLRKMIEIQKLVYLRPKLARTII